MLITTGGQSVRTRVAEVSKLSRATQGVKLIGMRKGESLQDIARIVEDEDKDDEEEGEDETAEGQPDLA